MDTQDRKVAVVFGDRADYENRVLRQRALKGVEPYVIFRDKSLGGVPDCAVEAPPEVSGVILAKSPETFSTWLNVDDNVWEPVPNCESDKDVDSFYDERFANSFVKRVKQLYRILQAIGFREISVVVSQSADCSSEFRDEASASANVNTPAAKVDGTSSLTKKDIETFKGKIESSMVGEYAECSPCDEAKVRELVQQYGFTDDDQIETYIEAQKRNVKSFVYKFSANFVGDVESQVNMALKTSVGIQRLPVNVDFDAKYKGSRKKHKDLSQSITLTLKN